MGAVNKGTAAALVGAAATAGARIKSMRKGAAEADVEPAGRWSAVTIARPVDEVSGACDGPGPLDDLRADLELVVGAAPGDKGTELRVRPRQGGPLDDADGRRRLRAALREVKQLVEVGEVLRVEPQPAGHRKRTPAGKVLEGAVRRGGSEGLL
jgi:hypothetical protein